MITALRDHDLVGLDTAIFVYFFEGVQDYANLVAPVFEAIETGVFHGATSAITLMELAVRPLQLGRRDIADEYEVRLDIFPNLTIRDVSRTTLRQAAQLIARHQLHGPDHCISRPVLKAARPRS